MEEIKIALKKTPITVLMILLNIVIFLILEILGDTEDAQFMYGHGAMSPYAVLSEGQWYRMFTSTFMHFGGEHLLNNIFLLFVLGQYVEPPMGHMRFLCLYLGAGITGAITSFLHMVIIGVNHISAGASGAIFGLIGALLGMILVHKGKFQGISLRGMIFMVVLSLYAGITQTGVDNFAHAGGFLGGLVICIFIYGIPYLIDRKKNSKYTREQVEETT